MECNEAKEFAISVIIPLYNKASFIKRAIDSVLVQTFQNFEIIVIDDNSEDDGLDIVRSIDDKRIRIFRRPKPGPGGYAARNKGANEAKNAWITFFDADDIIAPNHLEIFYESIQRWPDSDLIVNAYSKKDADKSHSMIVASEPCVLNREDGLRLISKVDFIVMNSVCVKKVFFNHLKGFPEGRFMRGGDVYFWLKAIMNSNFIGYNPTVTSWWLRDFSGVSKNPKNLIHSHPVAALKNEEQIMLSRREARFVNRAINRKTLSWAVEKKNLDIDFINDLQNINISSLTLRQAFHLITLLAPRRAFKWLRSFTS